MRKLLLTIVTLGALCPLPALAQSKLEALSWMVGSWQGTEGKREMEEVWTPAKGHTMLGLHRDVEGGRTTAYEFMRIQEEGETITFYGSPSGQPPTPFKLVESSNRCAVFENPTHDFPQRVIYWLDGEGFLRARIEGTNAGKPDSAEWMWRPAERR